MKQAQGVPSYEFRMLLQAQRSRFMATATDSGARRLRDIDVALARIHDGQYGACADCGGDIGRARLKADPIAMLCLTCGDPGEK